MASHQSEYVPVPLQGRKSEAKASMPKKVYNFLHDRYAIHAILNELIKYGEFFFPLLYYVLRLSTSTGGASVAN